MDNFNGETFIIDTIENNGKFLCETLIIGSQGSYFGPANGEFRRPKTIKNL